MNSGQPSTLRLCRVCGTPVGCYEPAIFVVGDRVVRSSRAAQPGLAAQPGCDLSHESCFVGDVTDRGRRAASPDDRRRIDGAALDHRSIAA